MVNVQRNIAHGFNDNVTRCEAFRHVLHLQERRRIIARVSTHGFLVALISSAQVHFPDSSVKNVTVESWPIPRKPHIIFHYRFRPQILPAWLALGLSTARLLVLAVTLHVRVVCVAMVVPPISHKAREVETSAEDSR